MYLCHGNRTNVLLALLLNCWYECLMNGYIIIVHYFVISYCIGSLWFFMVRINDGTNFDLFLYHTHPVTVQRDINISRQCGDS